MLINVFFNDCLMTIISKIYRNNFLNYLLPIIRKYHSDGQLLFWPDLATDHFAKVKIKFLKDYKGNFVVKKEKLAKYTPSSSD